MHIAPALALLTVLGGLVASPAFGETADPIWTGGTILTMNDVAIRAEAVAVKDVPISMPLWCSSLCSQPEMFSSRPPVTSDTLTETEN